MVLCLGALCGALRRGSLDRSEPLRRFCRARLHEQDQSLWRYDLEIFRMLSDWLKPSEALSARTYPQSMYSMHIMTSPESLRKEP